MDRRTLEHRASQRSGCAAGFPKCPSVADDLCSRVCRLLPALLIAALATGAGAVPAAGEIAAVGDESELRAAIRNNRSELLERVALLPRVAALTDRDGKTVLMAAAADSNHRLVGKLLDSGSDANASNDRGGTALMYAAANHALPAMRELLRHGADVNHRAENGWTAITLASAKGHADGVALLLANGADPNVPDVFGFTPLMRAVQNRREEVVEVLLADERTAPALINSAGRNALHVAMETGECSLASKLVDAGIDADVRDFGGRSARETSGPQSPCVLP